MVDRERLDAFRLRFGTSDPTIFERFRRRVVHAARESLSLASTEDRIAIEKEFAFRNGSRFVQGDNWTGLGVNIIHGILDELDDAKNFSSLTERIQNLLWTFESFKFFAEERNRHKEGFTFVGYLDEAIELSPGVDMRLQRSPGRVELAPAGVAPLDDVVDRATQWLAQYPDVQKEFRQTQAILASKDRPKFRQAQDSLRVALEKLLKLLLENNEPIENQGKALKAWLAGKGVHEDLRNVAVTIMMLLAKQYQNAAVKHDSTPAGGVVKTWSEFEVEYMLYQYAVLIRLLMEASSA